MHYQKLINWLYKVLKYYFLTNYYDFLCLYGVWLLRKRLRNRKFLNFNRTDGRAEFFINWKPPDKYKFFVFPFLLLSFLCQP